MSTHNTGRIFEIRTMKSTIIKSVVEIIKPYIKETNIVIDSKGLKISAIDTVSEKSVTHLRLDANKFDDFYCKHSIVIGVDINILFKTIKNSNRKDNLIIYMEEDDETTLCLELVDILGAKRKCYKIKLLELNDEISDLTSIDFKYIINFPSAHFHQIIKDIQLLGGCVLEIRSLKKQVMFECNDGCAQFKMIVNEFEDESDDDIVFQRSLLKQSGEDTRSIKFTSNDENAVQGKFSMKHLMSFVKSSHLCDNVNIYLDNDKPLVLEYFVSDLGTLKFLLIQEH